VSVAHGSIFNHSAVQRVAQIEWDTASPNAFFQSNLTAPGTGATRAHFERSSSVSPVNAVMQSCTSPGS
jgi:hypothetical protein